MVRVNSSGGRSGDSPDDQPYPHGKPPGTLVPIGKYKGQPVEVLANDPQYVEWLVAQPNIKQQHAHFYNVIINNFCEPNETPEHNAIHVRFLSEKFRRAFCLAAARRTTRERLKEINRSIANEISKVVTNGEAYQFAAALNKLSYGSQLVSQKPIRVDLVPINKGTIRVSVDCLVTIPEGWGTERENTERPLSWEFEFNAAEYPISTDSLVVETESGVDVEFCLKVFGKRFPLKVEIKPIVGDDFPAVLRQMKRSKANYLFLRSFGSSSVSREDFVEFFGSQDIRVVFEEEVERFINEPLPEVDLEEICRLVRQEFPS